jgi:putative membrane protein
VTLAEHAPAPGNGLLPIMVIIGILSAYLIAVYLQHRERRSWNPWRTASFSLGAAVLIVASAPLLANFGHQSLVDHMRQHLLLGMMAPLGLVLAAPVTLALRTLPARISRKLVILLHTRLVRFISHPVIALLLNVGGMYLLYLTPLYAQMLTHPLLHALVHLHFLLAGCLFTWAIAGPDPAPRRPGLRFRLGVLFVSVGTHAMLGKLMYAYGFPRGTHHGLEEIRDAAQLMYYGGDLAELCLAFALFGIWHRRRARRLEPAWAHPGRTQRGTG